MINAKKSVSNFKRKEGMPSSAMVTMRRERMWYFLDRLINLATPRIRDFRGLSDKSFDKKAATTRWAWTEQGVPRDRHGPRDLHARDEYQHCLQQLGARRRAGSG
ncbi:MAG: hypothetical protein R3B46_04415 [Phycisphaerales bacterium]